MKRKSNVDAANNALAIRIENGDFYLLGVRNAYTDYLLKEPILLDREDMIVPDTRIGYMPFLLELAKRNCIKRKNALLSAVKDYTRNGISQEDDKDIFEVNDKELSAVIDAFRDGDYIFCMKAA